MCPSSMTVLDEDDDDDDAEESEEKKKMQVKSHQASHTKYLMMRGYCSPGIGTQFLTYLHCLHKHTESRDPLSQWSHRKKTKQTNFVGTQYCQLEQELTTVIGNDFTELFHVCGDMRDLRVPHVRIYTTAVVSFLTCSLCAAVKRRNLNVNDNIVVESCKIRLQLRDTPAHDVFSSDSEYEQVHDV